jgi:predicted nucleotidyltransferase
MTADEVLLGWRDRIERVAAEESEHLARLPYVKGIAVIGGTGRGSAYPLSDVDMLTVVEARGGEDAEDLIRQVERERNARLAKQEIPNDIEPSEWVVLAQDLCQAVTESEDAFFSRLKHPHWLGVVIKAVGGRVFHDATGHLPTFLRRCNDTFYSTRFVQLWVQKVTTYCGKLLREAEGLIGRGDFMEASLEILRTTYQQLPAGGYAVWRVVPQSSARSVSRFLAAAAQARSSAIAEQYLAASRLDESTALDRLAAVPLEGKKARDLMWQVRRGAGEDVDELSVTRDILNLSLWKTVITDSTKGPRPRWTGATCDAGEVQTQYEAARGLLEWLCEQQDGPAAGSSGFGGRRG